MEKLILAALKAAYEAGAEACTGVAAKPYSEEAAAALRLALMAQLGGPIREVCLSEWDAGANNANRPTTDCEVGHYFALLWRSNEQKSS